LDSRTQENSTTFCANDQVYQLGPGNRAPNIPPHVVGTANEACNGVVYKILHSLMLPTPMEVTPVNDAGTVAVADVDADGVDTTVCKPIHDVLVDLGATEFSRLLQQREIDFKYGVFTVFAPPDNLILEAAENVNNTNFDDILYFHVAANVVEETLTDYCGTSLVMLNDMILDSRTQENSTTFCASNQVYQLGPGNRAPNIPPQVVGTANEACNGVVYKILHSLMLPTPIEVTPVNVIAPAPSPSTNPGRQPTTQTPPGEGSGGNGGGGVIPGVGPSEGSGVGPGVGPGDGDGGDGSDGSGGGGADSSADGSADGSAGIGADDSATDSADGNADATGTSAAPAFQLPSPPLAPTAPGRQPTTNPPPVPTGASDPSSEDQSSSQVPPFTLDDGGSEEPDSDSGSNYIFSCWNQFFVIIAVSTFLLHSFF